MFFMVVVLLWIGFYTREFLSVYHLQSLGTVRDVQHFSWWLGIFAGASIMTALIGRVYCGWICPFGAVMYILYRISPFKKQIPERTHRILAFIKYLLLLGGLTAGTAWSGLFKMEPFVYIFTGWVGTVFFGLAVFFILVALVIPYFWCRYLCFLGAWWGLLSWRPLIKYVACRGKRKCGQCAALCPVGAIKKDGCTIIQRECIRCNECQVCRIDAGK